METAKYLLYYAPGERYTTTVLKHLFNGDSLCVLGITAHRRNVHRWSRNQARHPYFKYTPNPYAASADPNGSRFIWLWHGEIPGGPQLH